MSDRKKTIFIANIPYDMTEQQLVDIFSQVGVVKDIRLVFDKDSGKPKGFGFCTFQDAATAASAVRNLNNYDVGGRQLRVDYAEGDQDASGGRGPPAFLQQHQSHPQQPPLQQQQQQQHYPPNSSSSSSSSSSMIPPPHPPPPAMKIEAVVASTDKQQLIAMFPQLKLWVSNFPDQARSTFLQNPQLSYALFHAMLVTNLIEPTTLQNVLEGRAPGALPPSLPLGGVGGVPPHMHHGVYPPPVAALPPVAAAIIPPLYGMGVGGGAAMPPSVYMQQPQVPLPQQQPLQPPPPPPPPTQQQLGLSASQIEALPDQQKILLMQVLSLTPQQIAAMSPVEQEQVKALRRQVGL